MPTKLIACEAVSESIRHLIPATISCVSLQFGLHVTPSQLHEELQRTIEYVDRTEASIDTLLLGYGMCSNAAMGLKAGRFRLVIPKVDDCIGLSIGSQAWYRDRVYAEPGTFYLTKGWIERGDDPYTEYLKLCQRYGPEKALRLERMVISHYTRLALISLGDTDITRHRAYAKRVASFFELEFEEITGSTRMITKLFQGKWDDEFVVVEPGGTSELETSR